MLLQLISKSKLRRSPDIACAVEGYADSILQVTCMTESHAVGVLCFQMMHWFTWISCKQACVVGSTNEAEFVVPSLASNKVVWLRRLLQEIRFYKTLYPPSDLC
jgi:hypothetical protein